MTVQLNQEFYYESNNKIFVEQHPLQIISTGQVVKAMILNGLGFVSAP